MEIFSQTAIKSCYNVYQNDQKQTEFNLQSNMKYVVRSVRLNLQIRKLTLRVPLVEQELSTLSVHMRSFTAFSRVHAVQS
jgi:hypothetical protein